MRRPFGSAVVLMLTGAPAEAQTSGTPAESQTSGKPPTTVQDAIRELARRSGQSKGRAAPARKMSPAEAAKAETEIREIVAHYGACMVRHRYARLKTFVLSNEETLKPPEPLPECVGRDGMLHMSGAIYRMVFADALLKRDFPVGVPPLDRTSAPQPSDVAAPQTIDIVGRLETMGRCVAYRDSAGSYRLALTKPSTAAENAEVNALMPSLKACGVNGVLPQPINNIRGAISVNLYRAAVAAGTAASLPVAKRN